MRVELEMERPLFRHSGEGRNPGQCLDPGFRRGDGSCNPMHGMLLVIPAKVHAR